MEIRAGRPADIAGVLELQRLNIVTNLDEEQKKNGFVTTPFTDAQLAGLIDIRGLFVAADGGVVRGYAMAAGWEYFEGRPMFDYMIERFSLIGYKGRMITRTNSFQYGPVCVAAEARGTACFLGLFDRMKADMALRYDIGTTFINTVNERSFQAHTRKAGLDVIDRFDFNGNHYYGLAFPASGVPVPL
ncbi:MAG: GNAT family acetyltransferase [Spirochaetae bacterium HGW-Spirochaetae-3]|jgi:hypothetical protein|nr:MAG: GNAT family acetyltransferase [Spirochaetae bacterium HGW-Spirochaetae-3]